MITTPNLGLKVWNLSSDPYNSAQLADNWARVDEHDHTNGKGMQIPTAGIADGAITAPKLASSITTTPTDNSVSTVKLVDGAVTTGKIADGTIATADMADGAITNDKLAAALANKVGVSTSSVVRRGKSIVAAEESRTNVAYGLLGTPDRVSSLVLPTDGLIFISFSGMFKSSGASTGSAAIFIGSNQLKSDQSGTAPAITEDTTQGTNAYHHIATYTHGLAVSGGVWTGDVTTGQTIGYGGAQGSICAVFAAAGTYDISIQFKASSGSVTAKERKLWVWTAEF